MIVTNYQDKNMTKFGRCMSKTDAKKLKDTSRLVDEGTGLVPVFGSPTYVEKRLSGMNDNQLRNYFRSIGVRSPETLVFFEVNSIDSIVGPIPQRNGLFEYKLPNGTPVEVYSTRRL